MNHLHNGVWLMEPERLLTMYRQLDRKFWGPSAVDVARLGAERSAAAAKSIKRVNGKVAVLSMHGLIEQRMSLEGWFFGSCPTDECGAAISALIDSKEVEALVLDIDSPGGTSYGVEELGDRVFAARQRKPIYAISNSMACSAAYWIASQATQVMVTPGGDVGSIGVYQLHMDHSGALDQAGVKVTIAKAGKYKTDGNPYEPLADSARDDMQETVDAIYAKFIKAVARGRGVSAGEVRSKYGEGKVLLADKAREVGMVDKVMTLEDLLQKLTGGGGKDAGARAAADELMTVRRLRHEQQKRKTGMPVLARCAPTATDDAGSQGT